MSNGRPSGESKPSFGWVLAGAFATLLVVGEMGIGGVWDLLRIPYARETMTRLGYPTYVLVILGAWKVPAALILMLPAFGPFKEWAYAGAFISYLVAAISHLAVGDELGEALVPAVFAGLVFVSRWLCSPASNARAHATANAGGAVAYWFVTGVLTLACALGGIAWSLHAQPFIKIMLRLGYPAYFMSILGAAYLAAGVVLVMPGAPRVKEWAYAGLVFNYVGAVASHVAVGDRAASVLGPGVLLVLALASWALRPPARRGFVWGRGASRHVALGS